VGQKAGGGVVGGLHLLFWGASIVSSFYFGDEPINQIGSLQKNK